MKMSVRPELTTAPPARVRDMRHTDGAVDNSALLPNHPGSTYKSGNAVQTAGATSGRRDSNSRPLAPHARTRIKTLAFFSSVPTLFIGDQADFARN